MQLVSAGLYAFGAVVLGTALLGSRASGPIPKNTPLAFRVAANLRTPVLMFVVIPLSYVRAWQRTLRMWWRAYVRRGEDNEKAHAANVQNLVRQIKAWNEAGRPGMLRTARPSWAGMSTKLGSSKADAHKLEVRHMNRILRVDEENLTVTAEPSVTMGELTHALMPRNLALQTHVEMETITIGGAALGFGIETNSHRVGLFQESVLEYELVDSVGTVHRVTEASDPELFFALPWSVGTLGFLLSITVRLVRTKPFVRVVYEATHSPEQLQRRMTELARMGADAPVFLEATMYSAEHAVIQSGWYADAPTTAEERRKVNRINDFWKPFYFRWIETFLDKGAGEDLVPLKHFLHRFTRSVFWELEDMIPFSNHPVYRCLWGWLGAPEVGLLKLCQGPVIRQAAAHAHVVQESIMPMHRLAEGVKRFDQWFAVYPLLVFPVRIFDRGELSGFLRPDAGELDEAKHQPLHPSGASIKSGLWVDLGAYGVPRAIKEGRPWDSKASCRAMEHWTRVVHGWCAVYTDIFCTHREFRQMFDHTLVDKCRKRLHAQGAIPEIYTKVKPEQGIADLSAELAAEKRDGTFKSE